MPSTLVREVIKFVHDLHLCASSRGDCVSLFASGAAALLDARCFWVGEAVPVRPDASRARLTTRAARVGSLPHAESGPITADADGVCSSPLLQVAITSAQPVGTALDHPALAQPVSGPPAGQLCSALRLPDRPETYGVVAAWSPNDPTGFSRTHAELIDMLQSEVGPWFWAHLLVSAPGQHVVVRKAGLTGAAPVLVGPNGRLPLNHLMERLTTAQRAVLPHLLDGKTEADIGKLIFRSRYTVHDHARGIYAAMGVRNRLELVVLFSRGDDLPPSPPAPPTPQN